MSLKRWESCPTLPPLTNTTPNERLLILQCRWLANPIIPTTSHLSYVHCTSLPDRHALTRAVPRCGQMLKKRRLPTSRIYRHVPSVRLEHCMQAAEGSCAHEKTVGEIEVRRNLIQLSPSRHGSSGTHLTDGFLNRQSGLQFSSVPARSGSRTRPGIDGNQLLPHL